MTDAPEYQSTFGLRRLGSDFVKDALERILEWKAILGMWGKWRIRLQRRTSLYSGMTETAK